MVKKWLTCFVALLLVFSMTLTSLVVYADEENNEPVSGEEGATGEENGSEEGSSNGGNALPNNNGASDSLEGFELVSSGNDAPENLDLYFYEKELAFKVAQKDASGNIVKVWSSQLLPQDLGVDPNMPVKYVEEKDKELDPNAPTSEDYKNINKQICKAEGKVESNYTSASWQNMVDALAAAKATWTEGTAKEEINAAEKNLSSAIKALEKSPLRSSLFSYDKQSLSLFVINYVNLGNTVTTTQFTTTSFEQEKQLVGDVVKTGSGVSFKVHFPALNITIPLTVEVDGQELNVTVPQDGFYENLEGAETVQEATQNVESLIEQINDYIEKTRKLIKNDVQKDKDLTKEQREKRINDAGNYLGQITTTLNLVKEATVTGVEKSANIDSLREMIIGLPIRFGREGYFDIEGVEENTEKIVELTNKCIENYGIIAAEIACGIYSLKVMPFMGSATITEKGYVFYPDGAGAISYFDTPHPALLGHYEQPVYMDHIFNLDYMWNDTTSNASMYPVWGVNKGDYGFVAIIEEGDVDANIEYWAGNEDYVLNRIFSSFMLRRKAMFMRGSGNSTFESYEIKRIEHDRKIKYLFLADEADYSAMANAYRSYLKENDMLNQAIAEGEEMPLAVDFLGGIKMQEVLWESTIPMTTYEQILAELEKLKADGVTTKIYSNLYDWTKQAYNPNPLNADGTLGGTEALTALTKYASENNVVLGLAVNPVWAQKDYATGDEMNKFFVRDATTLLVNYNNRTYVYSPAYIREKYASKIISKLETYGANCAQLNAIGYYLYYDYSIYYDTTTSRGDTAEIFAEIAKLSNEKLGNSSVSGANMFMWKYASRIDSMPLSDLAYLYSDESVPFLQMVLHGSIPYSGSVPYNVMYDDVKQKLEYIEYGCMPYFFLTEAEASEISSSWEATWSYDWLYSSDIATWHNTVISVYKEFSNNVGYLWSENIVHHMQIVDGVKRVEYSDGSVIYVNYNENDVTFADPISSEVVEIKGQSYEVRRGAEE